MKGKMRRHLANSGAKVVTFSDHLIFSGCSVELQLVDGLDT